MNEAEKIACHIGRRASHGALFHKPEDRAVAAVPGPVVASHCRIVNSDAASAIEKQGVAAFHAIAEKPREIVEIHALVADCEANSSVFADADTTSAGSVRRACDEIGLRLPAMTSIGPDCVAKRDLVASFKILFGRVLSQRCFTKKKTRHSASCRNSALDWRSRRWPYWRVSVPCRSRHTVPSAKSRPGTCRH